MPDQPSNPRDQDRDPLAVDTSVAYPSRVLDYLAGGDSNFAADRELADSLSDALPGGIDTDGLDMVDPGLVQIDLWRPDESHPVLHTERPTPIYVGVGRKP